VELLRRLETGLSFIVRKHCVFWDILGYLLGT
jgi:hypothetical protein